MQQRRRRAAAAMAKAAGQGGRSRHRCCALPAHSNIAARTPPASQMCRARGPRPTVDEIARVRLATRRRADLQSLEPNPIGPPKAPHKCPTATPTALRAPAAFAGTRATAALASSRSERPTSRDRGRERRRREKNTHTRHGRPHRCSAERRGPPGPPMRVAEPQIYRETAFEPDGRDSNVIIGKGGQTHKGIQDLSGAHAQSPADGVLRRGLWRRWLMAQKIILLVMRSPTTASRGRGARLALFAGKTQSQLRLGLSYRAHAGRSDPRP
jgi:hypothetical protein